MARYVLIDQWAADGNGKIIPSASIQVYVADTTTAPSSLYSAKTGGSAVTDGVFTADSSTARFTIYVDDGDYPLGSEFDVVVSKANFTTTYLYDVRG
jgi:hypothetical protein